ncbi:MAG: hypothetical protein U1F98_06370 [Verrucomicrobiota bacterium]
MSLSRTRIASWTLLWVLLLAAGCATRINWNARVGSYTYDQAVLDMGPPDKKEVLDDKTIVAEWVTHRGRPQVSGVYTYGYYWGPSPPLYAPAMQSWSPDYWLRLVFNPEGKLVSWKKFAM